uniref:Beta/gamma crystallin 'Greek key' domain-containing protein n=1 Tax=Oryzias sinensis TaxID=183150 RepID=A0A8C8DP59_9TELE
MEIVFYEDKNFSGKHFECSSDCADLLSKLSRCSSIKVRSGCFMIYEKPNFTGDQYYLKRGEYPDFHHWTGANDSVSSCRCIPTVSPLSQNAFSHSPSRTKRFSMFSVKNHRSRDAPCGPESSPPGQRESTL